MGPIVGLEMLTKLSILSIDSSSEVCVCIQICACYSVMYSVVVVWWGGGGGGGERWECLIRKENTALKFVHELLLSLKPDFKPTSLLRFCDFMYLSLVLCFTHSSVYLWHSFLSSMLHQGDWCRSQTAHFPCFGVTRLDSQVGYQLLLSLILFTFFPLNAITDTSCLILLRAYNISPYAGPDL